MGKVKSGHLAERVKKAPEKEKAESQTVHCPNCGQPLLSLPWGPPQKEWAEDGKSLVETGEQRYIQVCDNRCCRLYRNPQGSSLRHHVGGGVVSRTSIPPRGKRDGT